MKQLKKILSVLLVLAMIVAYVPPITASAEAETKQITITFDANKTDRESQNSNSQVWKKDGLTFTNNKDSSSNAVGDYSDPVRIYQGSGVVIECENMTKIVIVSDGTAKYKTALTNTLDKTGATYTTSGNNYTITFAEPVDSFSMPNFTAQARFKSITVSALVGGGDEGGSEGGETPSDPVMHDVSFDLNGYEGVVAPATIQVEDGKAYGDKLPSAPEREGYTFEGWALEDGTVVNAETVVSASHTLYAKWTEIVVEPDPTPGESEPDPTPGETEPDPTPDTPEGEPTELTITFDDKSKRTEYSTSIQVWKENGITVTNRKDASTTNVGDYANPARFYKSSTVIIECDNMTQMVIIGGGENKYITPIADTLTGSGYTYVVNGDVYTITFDEPTDSVTFVTTAQIRFASVTVTALIADGSEDEEQNTPNIVENWGVTLKDEVIMKFDMNFTPEILADNEAYVEVAVNGSAPYTVPVAEDMILSVPVFATQMTETITLTTVSGGEAVASRSFTLLQYCKEVLNNNEYSQYHALVKELLNYGDAAMKYFKPSADKFAGAEVDLTGTGKNDVPVESPAIALGDQSNVLDCTGASLVYRDKIAVRYYFTGSLTGCTFSVTGANGKAVVNAAGGYVEVPDILPQNLDQEITLSVTDGEGKVLTITYCPMNYIVRMSQKGSDTTKALVKALYNYYLAAKDFAAQTV